MLILPSTLNLQALAPADAKRSCFDKRAYTKNGARDAAANARKRGLDLNPYRCHVCPEWHLTSIPKSHASQVKNRQRNKKAKHVQGS